MKNAIRKEMSNREVFERLISVLCEIERQKETSQLTREEVLRSYEIGRINEIERKEEMK